MKTLAGFLLLVLIIMLAAIAGDAQKKDLDIECRKRCAPYAWKSFWLDNEPKCLCDKTKEFK